MLSLKDFVKYNFKNDTMNESELQRVYDFSLYPRDSKIYSDKEFININNGEMVGFHWTCFYTEDNKSYYFDSFRGQPDKFLLDQFPKPIIYHNYKIQDRNSRLCETNCLYSFYLIKNGLLRCCFKNVFWINVLGSSSSSYDNGNKIDTTLFFRKPFLRTNQISKRI